MINDDTYVKQNFCEQELDRNYTVAKIDTVCSLTVGEYDINPSLCVRNLGMWFDSHLSMSTRY